MTFRADRRFSSPITRMLLSGDGSTTLLLEALLGTSVTLRVLHQSEVDASLVAADVVEALELSRDATVLVRRSALVDQGSRRVSMNHVFACSSSDEGLRRVVTSGQLPIGYGLARRGVEHHRRILETGVGSWTNGSAARPAATRTYVICEQQRPILYIRETFNPDIVPVDLAPVAPRAVVQPPPAPAGWSPASWRDRPALQQPRWPDALAAEVRLGRIAAMPGLVTGAECRSLLADLAQVAAGQGFLVHAGDCAETFAGLSEAALRSRHRLLLALAQVIGEGAGMPPVVVGRIAGQYSKPRSCQIDEGAVSGGGTSHVANYFGDMINDVLPQPAARTPDPQRLLQAYFHSAATLNGLRNLHAVEAGNTPRVHSSHEALVLSFEQALTRFDDSAARWYSTSGHLIWIGERTRSLRGAHVEFASGIGNPVAVKIGPSATPEQVLAICGRLNPDHVPGRLTLIARLGAASVGQVLPPLVEAVRAADHPVVWCCDPMHANTITTASGYKTRRVRDVVAEIRGFFDVLRGLATHPGGIHLEVASEDVTECVGGLAMVREQDLPLRFETACDPRLNPSQALECAGIVAEELSRTTGHGMEPRYPRVTACAY